MDIQNLFNLDNDVILVTGGGTGLGQIFARTLAAAGARVIVCARRAEKLADTVALIESEGGRAHALSMDVTDAQSVKECLQAANAIAPITGLVNNAGIASDTLLKDTPESTWNATFDTNVKGCWLVANELAQQWIAGSKPGFIINIASVLSTSVQIGTGPYSAAKASLAHLTRAMAYEWARYNIRVNALAPGYFKTDINAEFFESESGQRLIKKVPQRRLGDLEDLAGAILLLASPASGYMTGSVIGVDGGLGLAMI